MRTGIQTKRAYPKDTVDDYLTVPTGLNTQDNAEIVSNIFRIHSEAPDNGLAYFRKNGALSQDMINRVYWLVHKDRLSDLTPDPINSFRRAISMGKREIPTPVEIPGISPENAKRIMAMLVRKPRLAEAQNGKPTEIYEADQLAMIFHLMRSGASRNAIASTFWHPATANAITAIHNVVRRYYQYRKSWNWVDAERLPLEPKRPL